MKRRSTARSWLARSLATLVASSAVALTVHAAPAAAVTAGPGQFASDVTTPDGGALEGTIELYQWDATDEFFGYYDEAYLSEVDGSDEFVVDVPDGQYYAVFYDETGEYLTSYSGGATTEPNLVSDPGVVTVSSTVGGNGDITLVAAPDPVTVTGTVVEAGTSTGIEGVYVEASGPSYDDAISAANGTFSLSLRPGAYELYTDATGYQSGVKEVTVPSGGGSIGTIELTPVAPGIQVEVADGTFGGSVEGAPVTLQSSSGGPVTTLDTDVDGQVLFTGVTPGSYLIDASHPDFEPTAAPVALQYDGGFEFVYIELEVDLSCEPASAGNGLTNMGFENGLTGWTKGYVADSVEVITGADAAFTSPWEGSSMARLGSSQPSSSEDQPEGPNALCQDFVVDQAEEKFAFNVFTYDYTGFDDFSFDLVVVDPATGETLASYQQGAWGSGTALKTSGWRGVNLDLADHLGEKVHLVFRAGGTSDSAYAFWTYLDSADTKMPPSVADAVGTAESETGSVMVDPITGLLTVAFPTASPSALTVQLTPECSDPEAIPTSVALALDAEIYPATLVSPGVYEATVPVADIASGVLTMRFECPSETAVTVMVGEIVLYDPSGFITDKKTGAPVVGAEVHLYKVPGWVPQDATGPHPTNSCQTNESKAPGAPWSQPAPVASGVLVNAASPEIHPNVNPFITDSEGHYGWDVAEGCWYVTVSAVGYAPLTSPVVGVPSAVTDLDLQLTSLACLAAQAALPAAQAKATSANAALAKATTVLNAAKAAVAKAAAAVKKAKAALNKAKASGDPVKIAKAKAKLKKAKAALKKAQASLAQAQTAFNTATAARNAANTALAAAQAAVAAQC